MACFESARLAVDGQANRPNVSRVVDVLVEPDERDVVEAMPRIPQVVRVDDYFLVADLDDRVRADFSAAERDAVLLSLRVELAEADFLSAQRACKETEEKCHIKNNKFCTSDA